MKTAGSERVVPLHPAVIEAGFLQFVALRSRLGSGKRVFRPGSGILSTIARAYPLGSYIGATEAVLGMVISNMILDDDDRKGE